MIEKTHALIVSSLSSIDGVYIDRYYGQLSEYNKPDIEREELPKILVDFVGDVREGAQRVLHFNLYFVHLSFSANKDYRSASLQSLAWLLEQSEHKLDAITECNIITKASRKIFDAAITEGYLSIFSRAISAYLTDEGVLQWME